MKIIQSFAQLDDGNIYVLKKNSTNKYKGTETYLNFYSALLSYLTLKKYYGSVTMYCNRLAYDTFVKYIPYDKIVIIENKHKTQKFWSSYKLDVIEDQNEDFIHVDSDVFVFEDLFKPFINNKKFDIIVQHRFSIKDKKILYQDMRLPKNFDYMSVNGGITGMRLNVAKKFIENSKYIFNGINTGKITGDILELGVKLEELNLYLTSKEYNFKIYDVIPYNDFCDIGLDQSSNKWNYTHMWFGSKFIKENITLIKNKIKKDFSDYYYIVEEYDNLIDGIKINYYDQHSSYIGNIQENPENKKNYGNYGNGNYGNYGNEMEKK